MASELRDFIPFGDIGPDLFSAVAREHPELPTDQIAPMFSLAKAVIDLIDALSRPVFDAGLSPARWRLLITLAFQSAPDGASIGEIAGHLQIKEPTVTATVNRAVADGLVERRKLSSDRRVSQILMTPLGHETVERMLPIIAGRTLAFSAALGGPEAIEELTRTIAYATDHVSAQEKE